MKSLLNGVLRRTHNAAHEEFEIFLGGNFWGRNVLIFTENINATYFISFDIPLRKMHAKGKVNFATVSQKHVAAKGRGCWERWLEIFRPDVVIMTRYGLPYGKNLLDFFRKKEYRFGQDILDFFKKRGVPIIYHIDDDLLEIPDYLGTEIRQRQGGDAVVEERRSLLENCDLIYASTEHLASVMQGRFPFQKIYHGIYAPYLGDEIQAENITTEQDPITIGYMGSKGHQHDLNLVVPSLVRLLEERPGLRFEVFGTIQMPEELKRFGKRVRTHSVQQSYVDFLRTLAGLGWHIGLAPLVDLPFNRCKAPTKFIEYTACSIPVVASEVPVYTKVIPVDGGRVVNDDWYEVLSDFIDHSHARESAVNVARAHCKEHFSLTTLEKQLHHVIELAYRNKALEKDLISH